jgi:hypothetical protein
VILSHDLAFGVFRTTVLWKQPAKEIHTREVYAKAAILADFYCVKKEKRCRIQQRDRLPQFAMLEGRARANGLNSPRNEQTQAINRVRRNK